MNIVITGASKGIGFQLAKLFAKDEKNTIIAIARNENLLIELQNECIKLDLRAKLKILSFDIENPEDVKNNFKNTILQHIESVDILINNAGFLVNESFSNTSINDIQKTFNINLISPAVIIQELLPLLKKGNNSHVVNISSMAGFQGSSKFPGLSFYSSSKAAIASLTECLAQEYQDEKICFNSLALGAVNTEMLKNAFPGYNAPINPEEISSVLDTKTNEYVCEIRTPSDLCVYVGNTEFLSGW